MAPPAGTALAPSLGIPRPKASSLSGLRIYVTETGTFVKSYVTISTTSESRTGDQRAIRGRNAR